MPATVVDRLEMIEIEHHHAKGRAGARGALPFFVDHAANRAPVPCLGQVVDVGQTLDTFQ